MTTTEEYPTLAEFAAALRSGEYKQGTRRLRPTEDTFCCLGVYGDLCVKKGLARWIRTAGTEAWALRFNGSDESYLDRLPGRNQNFNAPVTRIGREFESKERRSLAHANDCEGDDFATIAGYIEAKA